MRSLQIAAFAAAACIGLVGNAVAADMAVKAPANKVPLPAVYNWSGFYIGGEAGWQSSEIGLSSELAGASLTYNPRHDSFALGGFVGVQRQFGQLVLGVEGGYMAAFNDVSLGATPFPYIFFPGGTGTAQAKLRDIWSIGGRAGWAINNWMPYVAAGYGNGSFEFNAQCVPNNCGNEQAKTRTDGAYVGGGLDWAVMNNWILGIEYRHYFFGAKDVNSTTPPTFVPPTEPVRFDPETDTVMARLSYKFGWP